MAPIYLCTNLETGEFQQVVAGNRKAAHEAACSTWAGKVVEVVSLEEKRLRDILKPAVREIRSWADAAYCELNEVTDIKALTGCLDAIEGSVMYLRNKIEEVVNARSVAQSK